LSDTSSTLEARIGRAYADLPPNEQRLADTILSFPGELASYSANELAELAGVSAATASRFFKRIGYANFAEARLDARAAQRWGSPFYMQTREAQNRGLADSIVSHVETETANISHTFQNLSHGDLQAIVEALATGERVTCLGFRTSAMVADYAAWLLGQLRDNVSVIGRGGNTLSEQISGLGPRDVVLAIGLRRRLPIFAKMLRSLRQRGVQVILITDPTSQKSVQQATWALRAEARSASLFDSDLAANSLIHLICSLLATRVGQRARARMQEISDLHDELGEF